MKEIDAKASCEATEGITEYNMQNLYTSQILPHINEIKKICKINNLPFFISLAVRNEKGKTKYINDGVLTGSNQIGLYNDMFEKFLLVMHGGKVSFQDELDEEALNYILDQMPEEENNNNSNDNNTNSNIIETDDAIIDFVGDI